MIQTLAFSFTQTLFTQLNIRKIVERTLLSFLKQQKAEECLRSVASIILVTSPQFALHHKVCLHCVCIYRYAEEKERTGVNVTEFHTI